jgi:hypothetical protein
LRHQQPAQLRHLGHVGLHEQDRLGWIESERHQVDGGIERELLEQLGFADRRQGVQVGDEIVGLVAVLQVDVLADRTKVVAPVKAAGGLDAGENTHGGRSIGLPACA